MFNPLQLAGRAAGLGLQVAGGVFDMARGALGVPGAPAEPEAGSRPPSPPKPTLSGAALAHKVESELFRDSTVPKGKIDVNAVNRVVYLRGQAPTPQMVNELERRARAIPEVERVENLLHLPSAPAPTRTDIPASKPKPKAKPRGAKGSGKARKRPVSRKLNAERTSAKAEPSPSELAARGQGRQPAPLGSTDKKPTGATGTTKEKPASKASAAEPAPKQMAKKGQGRKPAPMGSKDPEKKMDVAGVAVADDKTEDVGS